MISLNIYPNYKSPQFKASYPIQKFTDIRDIRGLTCARCGGKMLSRPEAKYFKQKFLKSSTAALKSPIFDKLRQTYAFRVITELAQKHPRTPLVVIARIEKETKDKLVQDKSLKGTIEWVIEESTKMCKKASRSVALLNRIKDKLPEEKQAMLDCMEVLALKYPNKTFAEIFSIPEVKKTLQEYKKRDDNNFVKRFNNFYDRVVKIPQNSIYSAKITNFVLNIFNILQATHMPLETRKMITEDKIRHLYSKIKDEDLLNKLKKQMEKIPFLEYSPQASLSKYCTEEYNDMGIISDFVDEMTATWEHIIPDSKGGSKSMKNGLCMHKCCNEKRGNIPYYVVQERDSNFAYYIQKQMNRIMGYINHGNLLHLDRLPQEVKQTLLEVSNNTIRLCIGKFLKRQQEINNKKIKELTNFLQKQMSELQTTEQIITSNKEQIEKMYAQIRDLKRKINELKAVNSQQYTISRNTCDELKAARKELYKAQEKRDALIEDRKSDKS